jgi:hypothetical protein
MKIWNMIYVRVTDLEPSVQELVPSQARGPQAY